MPIPKVVLLAAYTGRSQAYAQMLTRFNHPITAVLTYGENNLGLSGQVDDQKAAVTTKDAWPDFSIPLAQTIAEAGWAHIHVDSSDVNSTEMIEAIKDVGPDYLVFSGYGSQIVSPELLTLGVPFLHCHSGYLPEFKGSTTVYYSLLKNHDVGVSCIVLDSQIDAGPIVARKRYPAPPCDTNLDYTYDTAIRADLLNDVLRTLFDTNKLPVERMQRPGEGTEYYIIHPVLKHVAIEQVKNSSN